MTFASALRSILRQDPDVIMVGEIRDEETARVAVQAALTGHLVLATLHTNDAPGAVARLLDMGIEPYLLSGALNRRRRPAAGAQRSARTARRNIIPTEHELADAGLADKIGRPFRKGGGCQQCHDTGFRGRLGIYEVMEVTPELRRIDSSRRADARDSRQDARSRAFSRLREEGVAAALAGKTSLDESLRVTHNEDGDEELIRPQPAVVPKADEAGRAA